MNETEEETEKTIKQISKERGQKKERKWKRERKKNKMGKGEVTTKANEGERFRDQTVSTLEMFYSLQSNLICFASRLFQNIWSENGD